MPDAVVACDLDHAALGGEVAVQDHESARLLERRREGPQHFLARRFDRLRGLRTDGAPRDGDGLVREEPRVRQALRHQADPAGGMQVVCDEAPALTCHAGHVVRCEEKGSPARLERPCKDGCTTTRDPPVCVHPGDELDGGPQ